MTPPAGSKRTRYGTRQLVEQVLRGPDSRDGLKTSELASKVQLLASKKIPSSTVFQAARSLVNKRVLEAKRDGREYRFPFDYPAVLKGEHMEQNRLLSPGDTIVVP